SGLWPFSTLGWPDQTPDLAKYYPTTLLVTGFDIIFFWAARMMVFGIEFMGEPPFKQIHIHGLVRDAEGQKMSKTKGNVVDPLEVNEKYGTDAVRFALLVSAAAGADVSFGEERLTSARNFTNKIWNASRLIFGRAGITVPSKAPALETLEDRWIVSRLNAAAEKANRAIENHRYHEAADAMWSFFWDEFCDWYLELIKLRTEVPVLLWTYERAMRLLHPMMPFITEELWQRLENESGAKLGKSISLAAYPQSEDALADPAAESEMATMQSIITAARTLRAERKVDRKLNVPGTLYAEGAAIAVARARSEAIGKLANVTLALKEGKAPKLEGAVRSTPEFDLVLELPEAEGERDRLIKENEQLRKVIENSDRQLANEDFIRKAPEKVIANIRQKKAEYEAQVAKNLAALDRAV
ncbi:MAG: class I tRNA ligase family protein, partial [Bryobacteraceae bacterium]